MGFKLFETKPSASAAWMLWIGFASIGILYLSFRSVVGQDVASATVAGAWLAMLSISILFSRLRIFFIEKNFLQSAMAWLPGFLIFLILGSLTAGGGSFSVFSVLTSSDSFLMASLAGDLPLQWEWFLNNNANPIMEESFWAVGLPMMVIAIMSGIGRAVPPLRILVTKPAQIAVLMPFLPLSFLLFHPGKPLVFAVIAGTLAFRGLLTVLWLGDREFNLVPYLPVIPSFLVGAHMGYNWGYDGLTVAGTVLVQYPIGWVTVAVLGLFTVVALYGYGRQARRMVA